MTKPPLSSRAGAQLPDSPHPHPHPPSSSAPVLDGTGMGIATLCLVHCLMLPALASTLPLFAAAAEAEWVHRLFVLAALPVAAVTVISRIRLPGGGLFNLTTFIGLALLIAAICGERMEEYETPLTVAGGIVLFTAHASWWLGHRRRS